MLPIQGCEASVMEKKKHFSVSSNSRCSLPPPPHHQFQFELLSTVSTSKFCFSVPEKCFVMAETELTSATVRFTNNFQCKVSFPHLPLNCNSNKIPCICPFSYSLWNRAHVHPIPSLSITEILLLLFIIWYTARF